MTGEHIRALLALADIRINGPNPWDIQLNNPRWYDRIRRDKSIGLGESYMDGWWDCERIDEMISRLLSSGIDKRVGAALRYRLSSVLELLVNLQSQKRAEQVATRHYDLDNDLFFSFLDPYKQYSCAFFESTDDLHHAQKAKLALIAKKLHLSGKDTLLDIGCGWGGLARYVSERFGTETVGVNISSEQLQFARDFCRDLPVKFLNCDYRAVEGRFDKVVSVGMFEHVGWKNYRAFFKTVDRCLNERGIFLLHTITSNVSAAGGFDPWMTKHIFPNSMLPGPAQIASAAEKLFVIEDWHNLGPHYDKTLMAWYAAFQSAWPRLRHRYDEKFRRMWSYYLLSCAGAFRAREIQVCQILFTKRGTRTPQPRSRF